MPTWTLGLVAAMGLGHIIARTRGRKWLAGILKPLPIALLVVGVLREDPAGDPVYQRLVAMALLASMAGDILLLWPRRFVAGLLCFLTAHLVYIAAFMPAASGVGGAWAVSLPFVLFAAGVLRFLWPHLGRYRAPVLGYVAVIATMGWLATLRALGGETAPASAVLAALGAFAFMTSDTILAVDRFAHPFRGAPVGVMSTYYTAQLLLALSAVV